MTAQASAASQLAQMPSKSHIIIFSVGRGLSKKTLFQWQKSAADLTNGSLLSAGHSGLPSACSFRLTTRTLALQLD